MHLLKARNVLPNIMCTTVREVTHKEHMHTQRAHATTLNKYDHYIQLYLPPFQIELIIMLIFI